jgi:hypothetical protein
MDTDRKVYCQETCKCRGRRSNLREIKLIDFEIRLHRAILKNLSITIKNNNFRIAKTLVTASQMCDFQGRVKNSRVREP